MICEKCNSEMNVKSQVRMKDEGKDEPRNIATFVCPKCKHSIYKDYSKE